MTRVDCAIIGGGAVGRAIARALSRRFPAQDIVVVERRRHDRLENQSTRNSGVIHAGIYYRQEERPHKARLCVQGNRMLYEFCAEHGVRHARCGKLVVATDAREEEHIREVLAIATANQVPAVRLLSAEEVRAMEPNIRATSALHAPSSGVIDAADYLRVLTLDSKAHSLFDTEVRAIEARGTGFVVHTSRETFETRRLINAAGLYADDIARMLDPDAPYRIMPVRGESAKFYSTRRPELSLSGMNIYPAPCGFYKDTGERASLSLQEFRAQLRQGKVVETVGVHLTPTLDEAGRIANTFTVGPAVTIGVGKDDHGTSLRPPSYFWERVHAFFPGLRPGDLELHQSGIQARLADDLDWLIEPAPRYPNCLHLIGIDSPGLTASLAIAEHVVSLTLG